MKCLPRATVLPQRGFSLIELLVVIGVIAVLVAGAFVAYPMVRDRQQGNAAVTTTSALVANVESLYVNTRGYAGLDTDTVINGKMVPASMLVEEDGEKKVRSAWGGNVEVLPAAGRGWALAYEDVPSSICSGMASSLWRQFSVITINNTTVKANAAADVDVGAIADGCSADGARLVFGRGPMSADDIGQPAPPTEPYVPTPPGGGGGDDTPPGGDDELPPGGGGPGTDIPPPTPPDDDAPPPIDPPGGPGTDIPPPTPPDDDTPPPINPPGGPGTDIPPPTPPVDVPPPLIPPPVTPPDDGVPPVVPPVTPPAAKPADIVVTLGGPDTASRMSSSPTYTAVVTNVGGVEALSVVLGFGDNSSRDGNVHSYSTGWSCVPSSCTLASLAPGASATVVYASLPRYVLSGSTLTVSVAGSTSSSEATTGNNNASKNTTLTK